MAGGTCLGSVITGLTSPLPLGVTGEPADLPNTLRLRVRYPDWARALGEPAAAARSGDAVLLARRRAVSRRGRRRCGGHRGGGEAPADVVVELELERGHVPLDGADDGVLAMINSIPFSRALGARGARPSDALVSN